MLYEKIFPVVLILFLLVGGYLYFNLKNKLSLQTPIKKEGPKQKNNNLFASIQDALSKSISIKCTYKNKEELEKNGLYKKSKSEDYHLIGSRRKRQCYFKR